MTLMPSTLIRFLLPDVAVGCHLTQEARTPLQPLMAAAASHVVCQMLGYWNGKVGGRALLLIQHACQEQQLVV